ncbi:MAG TPA: polyprenyl synthetase family protein [Bacteroidales bacterium]|jgi:geranylgeranyl diphosphate synthase type II|nr:polyprenyl synthetase family protein [Bacteroidales bacterium]
MFDQSALKEIVNNAIINLSFDIGSDRLIDPVKYVLSMGGKRMRPVLSLMACNLFSDKIDHAVIPVTGIEIFHNFTLVHDDIMDNARIRRGFPTVHTKWNINQAILSGDVMAFITNECFLQSPAHLLPRVLKVFNRAAIEVCAGQQLDMDFERATYVSQAEYIRMIGLKTAALIAASLKIGAIFGGADDKDAGHLYEYGKNLGLAFQIQDDILDVFGDMKVFGKTAGGDIIEGKKTFLYVRANETGSFDQKKKLQDLYASNAFKPEDKIRMVTELYELLDVKSSSEKIVADYFKDALEHLGKVNISRERKEGLIGLTSSLAGRDQ